MRICSWIVDSNLIGNESVHHRGHGGRRDIIFSDETRMIADERRLKNCSSLFYRYFPLRKSAFICVSIKI